MQAPTTPGWRLLRGGVFALVATQLAALGHATGGGSLPDPAALLTVAVFVGGSVAALATRRRSWLQICGVLSASQLLFHLAFLLTTHHSGPVDTGRMLAFHALAAVLAASALTGGESALFRLYNALRRALSPARVTAVVCLPPGWTVLIAPDAGLRLLCDGALTRHRRRGPPSAAPCAAHRH